MSDPRVKKEPAAAAAASSGGPSTTIGGAQKVSFAPRIPIRRKAGEGVAASAQAGSDLRDLITTKVEKKAAPRALGPRPPTTASAARVAFQPSVGPGQQSVAAGEEQREVAIIVTHQTGVKIPGQHEEPEGGAAPERKPRVKKEGGAGTTTTSADGTTVTVEDAMDEDADDLEASAEAELSEMLARENAYDQFLDNGDARQYRPILLPFPRVRLGAQGAASAARSAAASPATDRPSSAFGAATSMFDVSDDTTMSTPRASSVAGAAAPYKALPLGTPARLLGQIDHEEKMSGGVPQPTARNILFFQFPSHLPFKQASSWAPPVNPLLSLNGFRQSSLGSSSSAITFGANTNDVSHTANQAASRHIPTGVSGANNNLSAPSPSLQALHALSSPALPPLHAGIGMPGLSLGSAASKGAKGTSGGGSASGQSGLMDDVGTSSALATEEEQDLGEVGKGDGTKVSESERLAREHKARQQRKLLLFSSNFEHAMRHLPAGQLGSLVIYKSGKIKMKIGDVLLDVNEGVQCLFHQELMSVQASTGEAFRLGQVNHRLVCTNDVEDLVRKTRERAVPQPREE